MNSENEKICFDNFLKLDKNPGTPNRVTIEGDYVILPGWILELEGNIRIKRRSIGSLAKKLNINSQILYDVLILGLTDISQRPKCPNCGSEIKFRKNLFGKFSGYNHSCSTKCRYELNKPLLLSEEAIRKSVKTRMETGGYDHMFGNHYRKLHPPTKESIRKQADKMRGRKLAPEHIRKLAEGRSKFYKENPDKLEKLINAPRGKSKRGSIKINKFQGGKDFSFLSSWEEKFLMYIDTSVDFIVEIDKPKAIQYDYGGSIHNYYADVEITFNNGKKLLIEIKPSSHLYHEKNKAKFDAGKNYTELNKDIYYDYLILTEDILFCEPRKQDTLNESKIKETLLKYLD